MCVLDPDAYWQGTGDALIGKRRRIALNVVSTRGGGRGKLSSQVIVSQTVRAA